jgi:hypothetical protein
MMMMMRRRRRMMMMMMRDAMEVWCTTQVSEPMEVRRCLKGRSDVREVRMRMSGAMMRPVLLVSCGAQSWCSLVMCCS